MCCRTVWRWMGHGRRPNDGAASPQGACIARECANNAMMYCTHAVYAKWCSQSRALSYWVCAQQRTPLEVRWRHETNIFAATWCRRFQMLGSTRALKLFIT